MPCPRKKRRAEPLEAYQERRPEFPSGCLFCAGTAVGETARRALTALAVPYIIKSVYTYT